MKAFIVNGPGVAELGEWPTPRRVRGDVVVTPQRVGICGTDLELVDGTLDPSYVRYPLVLGHEWVGRIEHEVAGVGPTGTPVVVEGIVPCNTCDECARGATNLCMTYDEIGFTRAGALAEHVRAPEGLVHVLSDVVALDDAVFIEPMAVVWRALTRMPLRHRLRVAVIGDGPIALLAAHMMRLFKPTSIIVFGQRAEQRELAERAGADDFLVTPPTDRFDLIIEASGSQQGVTTAMSHCERGAIVILLGLPPHGSKVDLSPGDIVNNDLVIQVSFSYTRASFREVVQRVNNLELRPSFLITHRFTLESVGPALAALRGGTNEPRGKIVIDVAGD